MGQDEYQATVSARKASRAVQLPALRKRKAPLQNQTVARSKIMLLRADGRASGGALRRRLFWTLGRGSPVTE
jgi:hypothetical protein